MRTGLAISAVLVVVLGIVVFSSTRPGPADPPTVRTAPERLARVDLPADLPPYHAPPASAAPYGPLYDRMLSLYRERRGALQQEPPVPEAVDELVALLIEAAAAGGASPGFLDKHLAMRPAAEPGFGDALEGAAAVALAEAQRRWEAGDRDGAAGVARAVWALGERAFRDNLRLYPRTQGLGLIAQAGMAFYDWLPAGPVREATLRAWGDAADAVDAAWTPKIALIRGVEPLIGDLLNIARHDADRTFRVEALLQLGILRYAPRGRGNAAAIEETIEQATRSDDPAIAEAAAAAAAFTREEMRRVR